MARKKSCSTRTRTRTKPRSQADSAATEKLFWLLELDVHGAIYRYRDLEQRYLPPQSLSHPTTAQRSPTPPPNLGPPDERLALYAMTHPQFRLPLVGEHVETRPLYNSLHPGIEQVTYYYYVLV